MMQFHTIYFQLIDCHRNKLVAVVRVGQEVDQEVAQEVVVVKVGIIITTNGNIIIIGRDRAVVDRKKSIDSNKRRRSISPSSNKNEPQLFSPTTALRGPGHWTAPATAPLLPVSKPVVVSDNNGAIIWAHALNELLAEAEFENGTLDHETQLKANKMYAALTVLSGRQKTPSAGSGPIPDSKWQELNEKIHFYVVSGHTIRPVHDKLTKLNDNEKLQAGKIYLVWRQRFPPKK